MSFTVSNKIYLQKQAVGWIWSMRCSLLIPHIERGVVVFNTQPRSGIRFQFFCLENNMSFSPKINEKLGNVCMCMYLYPKKGYFANIKSSINWAWTRNKRLRKNKRRHENTFFMITEMQNKTTSDSTSRFSLVNSDI